MMAMLVSNRKPHCCDSGALTRLVGFVGRDSSHHTRDHASHHHPLLLLELDWNLTAAMLVRLVALGHPP